ncbi:MAG: DNA polymerase III subunit gamma/tau, partial [Gallionella sp.]|nr:DNA polymerase III subunit gamma/tau [Gallionella sp.]
ARDEIDLAPDEYAGFTMALLRMLAFVPAKGVRQPMLIASVVAAQPRAQPVATAAKIAPSSKPAHTREEPDSAGSISGEAAQSNEVVSASQLDWGVLLTLLNVQGMAQQLAKNCVLKSFSDGQITLCLSQEYKHLQTSKNATEKLQAALGEYFAKPMKLNIVLGTAGAATPALKEHQDKQFKQQQAIDSIVQDDFVREAQAGLDASLITESIKPI